MTEHKSSTKRPKIAVLWRGDAEARRTATPQNNRFHRVFEELAAIGVDAEPAVYDEEFADEVRQQLLVVDGVLVWVDPIHQGKTRTALDPFLREVAAGPWVSAHPDVILQMGVKEVLYRTKHLGWGTGTYVYRTIEEFASAFPPRLRSFGPRALGEHRHVSRREMRHHRDRIFGIGGQPHQSTESGSVKEQDAVFGDPTNADDETMGPPGA